MLERSLVLKTLKSQSKQHPIKNLNTLCEKGVNSVNIDMLPFKVGDGRALKYYNLGKLKQAIKILKIQKLIHYYIMKK